MDMQVRHGLSGLRPVIDPDIERIRLAFIFQLSLRSFQYRKQGPTLLFTQLEEGLNMPFRNNQGMRGTDRKAITNHHEIMVFIDEPIFGQVTEWAG